jgi:hypothetical protein
LRSVGGGGVRRDDLLETALLTDWPVSRLLVAGGTCMSTDAEASLTVAVTASWTSGGGLADWFAPIGFLRLLHESGTVGRDSVRRILDALVAAAAAGLDAERMGAELEELSTTLLRRPASLQVACRTAIRRRLAPRVLWGSRRLPLPELMRHFVELEC